jgi:quercetin dioxygenase-like cupin family protein
MTHADAYFAMHSGEDASGEDGTWFDLHRETPPFEMSPGLTFRPAIATNLLMNLVTFEKNTVAPVHAHAEEQISYVLEGEMEFEVNGETHLLKPGMGVIIPPYAAHGARTYDTTCSELDIFHPPRRALLDAMNAQNLPGEES